MTMVAEKEIVIEDTHFGHPTANVNSDTEIRFDESLCICVCGCQTRGARTTTDEISGASAAVTK